jgi:hypothetical protein
MAMEVATDSQKATQGEPIMLSVVLKGSGNFERISGPEFPDHPDWKHYSPETKFAPSGPLGLSGNLRFDYVFIPERSGQLELPETRFSYFDPEQEEYVELVAPPIRVEVAASQNNPPPPPDSKTPSIPERNLKLSRNLTSEEALLTLDYRPETARTLGYAILESPGFIIANLLSGFSLATTAILLRRQRHQREDPAYPMRAAAKRALKDAKSAYQQALQQEDIDSVYEHGQTAIRHAASIRSHRSMQSASSEEIAELLSGPVAEDCRAFFAAANAHRFGGRKPQQISKAAEQIERTLEAL